MKKLALVFVFLTSVCWGGDNLKLLIGPEEISQRLSEVAVEIDEEYREKNLTVIMVMKGAICIAADLIRHLHIPCTVEYVQTSSYGRNGVKRGELSIKGLDDLDLASKDVLLVDDIFDTGHTMTALLSRVQEKNPNSLKTLVLLVKNVPRSTVYRPDFTLFEIENHFVVGYGLDYKENYRGLPGVYYFENDNPVVSLTSQ